MKFLPFHLVNEGNTEYGNIEKSIALYFKFSVRFPLARLKSRNFKNYSCHSLSYVYFIFHNLGKSKRGDTSIKRKKLKDEDDWEPEIHDIKVEEDEDITDDLHDKGKL